MKNIFKLAIGAAAVMAVYKAGELSGIMTGINSFVDRSDEDIKHNRMTVKTGKLQFTVERPADSDNDVVIE